MGIGLKSKPLFVLAALLLLAGGAVLGMLQVRWVREASSAEETRLRASLQRGASQVRGESEDEIRALLSLTRLSAADVKAARWDEIEDNVSFWLDYSRFPGLLRGLYIVRRPPAGDAFVYSIDSRAFSPSTLPAEVRTALQTELSGREWWPAQSPAVLPGGGRLVVLPASSDGVGRPSVSSALIAAVLDTAVIYGSVVPFYMRQNLDGYPYRIVKPSSGAVLAESETAPGTGVPEARIAIGGFSATFRPGGEPEFPWGGSMEAAFMVDPLLQPWLQRTQTLPARDAVDDADAVLQIFYPGGTIAAAMRRQSAFNIGISLGIIAALLASLAVLSRQYGRTARLRMSEQEFVASIGHELRTPISVIQAASDNLTRGVVSDPARLPRYAEVIHGQIKRLSGMVESILLYSGLESDAGRRPAITDIDLPAFISDIVVPMQELASGQGSSLRLVMETPPARIRSDVTALRLILENLVVNAVRHAGPCAITLTVGRRPFEELRITVEDGGPGIPAREQGRVFEPFFRGEKSVSGQRPGSGLGLHLVKRVVSLLGGKVSLESPYENLAGIRQNGCRFAVLLPIEESDG
jgi:signal transduction histidine kinase